MKSPQKIHKSPIIVILVIITVILTIFQFTTLERIKQSFLSAPCTSGVSAGASGKISALVSILNPGDLLLFTALAMTALIAVLMEIRSRRISSDYSQLLKSDRGTLSILLILAVASARFYLAPGEITLGDSPCHMSRVYAAAESISSGSWPSWSFYNYCGYPLLRFYAPGFFLITGAFSILTNSPDWTVKAILFLLHAGSAFPVYFWARAIGASRASSLLSGAIITLSFLHTHTVIWTGSLPISAVFILYPLIFLAIEKLLRGGGGKWVVILATATSSIVLFHHGYAAYGIQLAAFYLLLRWMMPGGERPGVRSIIRASIAIAAGLLFCTFFLFPVLTEGRWVFLPEGEWRLRPSIPDLAFLRSLLVWRNIWSGWTVAYIGLSVFVFFLAGVLRTFRNPGDGRSVSAVRTTIITALFALLCAAGRGRVINLALPFIAIMAGMAVSHMRRERSIRLSLLLLVILLIDLGPTTIQSPYRTDRSFIGKGLRSTGESISPERIIIGFHDGSNWAYPHWGYSEGTGIIQPTGFFPQGAPRMINTVTATLDNLNSCGDSLDTSVMDQLFLLNVSGLVMRTRDSFIEPEPSGSEGPEYEQTVSWILPSSPLIYSGKVIASSHDSLTTIQESGLLMDLPIDDAKRRTYGHMVTVMAGEMEIDRENATAGAFFLWPGQAVADEAEPALIADGKSPISINHYSVSLDRTTIRFNLERPGWIRASFSWYPSMQAAMDGASIDIYRSMLGACIMQIPAGEHTLELGPDGSGPFRGIVGLLLGLITLGIALRFRDQIRPVFSK